MADTKPDYYAILEVKKDATPDEIRDSYRKLAKLYHPDIPENQIDVNTAEKFKRIQEAYDTLIDPEKRKEYDKSLSRSTSIVSTGGKVLSTMDKVLSNPTLAKRMDAVTNNVGWNFGRMMKDMDDTFGRTNQNQKPKEVQKENTKAKNKPKEESPLAILKRRYAKGEISKEKYLEMKKNLK